jgi:hypothetical protein
MLPRAVPAPAALARRCRSDFQQQLERSVAGPAVDVEISVTRLGNDRFAGHQRCFQFGNQVRALLVVSFRAIEQSDNEA